MKHLPCLAQSQVCILTIVHSLVPFWGAQFIPFSILGFVTLVEEKNLNVITTDCLIHGEAHAFKTLLTALKGTSNSLIQIVNYIKGGAVNT